MALVKRLVKGSALTYAEGDGNLTYLDNKVTGSVDSFPVFNTVNTVTTSNITKFGSMITIDGGLTVTGDLTAMQYIISSSVTHFTESFSSGSTVFGDTLNDTHQFTGSVYITGSLNANLTGSVLGTGSYALSALSSSYADVSSQATVTSIIADTTRYLTHVGGTGTRGIAVTTNKLVFNPATGSVGINKSTITSGYNLDVAGNALISGSLLVTGSSVFSGSATGVVNSLSIVSNTASLDLSRGNFFTLQLVGGANTYINPSNIQSGQTVSILLSTVGSGTVSFPTNVLQQSGSAYVPTTTTGKDIITLVTFDTSNLYLANVKNLI